MIERTPPYDESLEMQALGSLMILDDKLYPLPKLQEDDFYLPSHKAIYKVIASLYDNARPTDPHSIFNELKKTGETRIGAADLFGIMEMSPSRQHADHFAEEVRRKAQLRHIISAATEILKIAYDETGEPTDLIDQIGAIATSIARRGADKGYVDAMEGLAEAFKELEKSMKGEGAGLRTGFHDLDQRINGLQGGQLIIIAARPSMGKSSFAMNIGRNVAEKCGVLMFSLEVSARNFFKNLLASESRMCLANFRGASELQFQKLHHAADNLKKLPMFVCDASSLTLQDIRSSTRYMKYRHEIGLVIVDYLQLVTSQTRNRRESREAEVAQISRGLKSLAMELDIPIIALGQLNREVDKRDDRLPRLSDLRESGAIEQDADIVMLLHRPGYYSKDPDNLNAKVIVAKQRQGQPGDEDLLFFAEFLRFENKAMEMVYQ